MMPNEKLSQEIQDVLGLVDGRGPMDVLTETGDRLTQMLGAAAKEDIERRPQPDKWSISEAIAHLADLEMVFGYRVRIILENPGIILQAIDQDRWAALGQYQLIPHSKSLERLLAQREVNILLLRCLSLDQWKQFGIHPERGQQTIADVVKMWANHDLTHLRAFERLLQTAD